MIRLAVLVLLSGCLLGGVVARADEPVERVDRASDEEPVLEGEAKKAHDAEVKRLVEHLLDRKSQDLIEEKIGEVGAQGTRAARDALIRFVTGRKSKRHVQRAFEALARIGGKVAVETLCGKEALRSRDAFQAQLAADALALAKDPRAVGPLLDVMTARGTKTIVVGAAAIALGKSAAGDEKASATILESSRDKRATVRAPVVEAHGFLAGDESYARLLEALADDDNAVVRAAAATGLGHAGRAEAIDVLEKATGEERSSSVREAIVLAITKLRGG
jgi:HEAT repeat protein